MEEAGTGHGNCDKVLCASGDSFSPSRRQRAEVQSSNIVLSPDTVRLIWEIVAARARVVENYTIHAEFDRALADYLGVIRSLSGQGRVVEGPFLDGRFSARLVGATITVEEVKDPA